MTFHRTAAPPPALLALTVLALAAAAACGKPGSPDDGAGQAGTTPSYEVKRDVSLTGSPVFDKIKGKKITIGVKADQPGLGLKNPVSGARSGFDIEIAEMVAADLGFAPGRITWKDVPSEAREQQISSGGVDLYVGTYTINDERKKQVGFAGPYYLAGQDLLVKKGSPIKGPDDLKGRRVCSTTGSTPLQRIKKAEYGVKEARAQQNYQTCVQELANGTVDAVTTDDAILKGYAAQNAGILEVVGKPFSEEPYGIGLKKEDKVLRDAVDDALEAHERSGDWKQAYEATLAASGGSAPTPPKIERY
jgi:glutamate transport system substrate-binding protein